MQQDKTIKVLEENFALVEIFKWFHNNSLYLNSTNPSLIQFHHSQYKVSNDIFSKDFGDVIEILDRKHKSKSNVE